MIFVLVLFGVPTLFLGVLMIIGIISGLIRLIDNDPWFDPFQWFLANWIMGMVVCVLGGITYGAWTYM